MKKCKICKTKFEPLRPLQMVCSPNCGYEYTKQMKAKQWKQRKAEIKENLMTRSDYLKIAQTAFNAYIRERDKDKPCISCGSSTGKSNAGHYMSVGSTPELRFNEDNVHRQCEHCNSYLSGNLINYRINLIERIGLDKVEFLERKDHDPNKLTIEEIKAITKKYREKLRKLQK
jgi:hypothetical protein